MRIAVCDDEKPFRKELKRLIDDYFVGVPIEYITDEYPSGEDFIKSKLNYDLIFMDYQMKTINGLDTAAKIRRNNENVCIVFVTSFPSVAIDAYEVSAFRFLVKPVEKGKFAKAMADYLEILRSNKVLQIKSDAKTYNVNVKEIICIEAKNKGAVVSLKDKSYAVTDSFSHIEEQLPADMFFKTHRAFSVNLLCVDSFTKNEITLSNGQKALLSRNKADEFNKAHLRAVNKYEF